MRQRLQMAGWVRPGAQVGGAWAHRQCGPPARARQARHFSGSASSSSPIVKGAHEVSIYRVREAAHESGKGLLSQKCVRPGVARRGPVCPPSACLAARPARFPEFDNTTTQSRRREQPLSACVCCLQSLAARVASSVRLGGIRTDAPVKSRRAIGSAKTGSRKTIRLFKSFTVHDCVFKKRPSLYGD